MTKNIGQQAAFILLDEVVAYQPNSEPGDDSPMNIAVRRLNDVPGITCRTPGGAFYAWPNVTEACRRVGAADSETFRKRLLHEAGIAVLADIHFGRRVPGDGQHIRFSYAASNAAIEQGIARLDDFVRKHTA